MRKKTAHVMAAIDYIENHLMDRIDLDALAAAVGCSKFHLHRTFTETVGVTVHGYAKRRQLTEAAKLLVFSDQPIIDIALLAGYESQQAFSAVFRDMYKRPPHRYREAGRFYPLRLRHVLLEEPPVPAAGEALLRDIVSATPGDIPQWMALVNLVIDGFPCLEEGEHVGTLKRYIAGKRALILKRDGIAVGAMMFTPESGSIDFFGIHPQYRNLGIAKAFLDKFMEEFLTGTEISITTYREGDKADPGYRETYRKLGFSEAEPLFEFGYPTQRFVMGR